MSRLQLLTKVPMRAATWSGTSSGERWPVPVRTLTIADISSRLGFTDPSAFGLFFRRLDGATPGAFRQRGAHRRDPA